jgi:hypothetical protein
MALAGWVGDGPRTLTVGEGTPDIEAARRFDRYPLYWIGERFEGWDLERIEVDAVGSDPRGRRRRFAFFSYGTCELQVPADGGCGVTLTIRIEPHCERLAEVASGRTIRGAPLNFSYSSDPILYTDRVRITVFTGQGSTRDMDLRALRALRSVNDVPPVLDVNDPIPRPRPEPGRPCRRS